ncbi:hypothetical protein [Sphingobium algorifonticola]|uniref:Uncharacterized protein n=1 Tax=Sphingobium algorifonticola TaxID=2008318 RepID=A0A437J5P1_9SPHN|nr:hypothetical protein [Sphingobium algorifonticola]RVT40262.1 hypothetical protein ENE74_13125 [Sphingobium algorifonticola]
MDNPDSLKIAYAANILILVPVCYAMLSGPGGTGQVFQGQVTESAGLRLLVGSLWAAILMASVGGFWAPAFFAPLLLIQIAYKALWLALFVLPLLVSGQSAAVPWGITLVFAAIVMTYPLLYWRAM